jgi:hypothetical protein
MKNVPRIVFPTLASLILTAAVWALPPTTTNANHVSATTEQGAGQPQSVSGKIASVGKDSFTLTVAAGQTANAGQQFAQQAGSPKTMTFLIDKNTTVEGKLKVDANAEVTYRQDNGNNVAISVRVTP